MGLSTTQRFLVEATRTIGAGEYFRWGAVGTALGYSAAESQQVVQSLAQRKLITLLVDGNARLLVAGRHFAVQLERKLVAGAPKR